MIIRLLIIALSFSFLFSSCGGSSDDSEDQEAIRIYSGTLSGNNCLTTLPQEEEVVYVINFQGFTQGAPVNLTDQNGIVWTGTMLSSNSFIVANATIDSRFSITITEILPRSAQGSSITSCQELNGCCTTLEGSLSR